MHLIDAYDPEIINSPYSVDRELSEQAPVYYDATNDIYLVSGYDLVVETFRDSERFSNRYFDKVLSKDPPPPEVIEILSQGFPIVDALLVSDGEVHDRHRKMITKAFSRKRLDELAPRFAACIAEQFAAALARGSMAFRAEIGNDVPVIMTKEQLRIADEDLPQLIEWSHQFAEAFGGTPKTLDQLKQEAHELVRFQRYFEARVRSEMDMIAAVGEGTRDDDLLTMMAHAIRDPGNAMDMVEALSFLLNLLPATHDTTTASMTACMHRFVADPKLQQRLAEQPDLIPKFVDEAMRHESPLRQIWRRAAQDVEMAGVHVPAGSYLLLRISSANRDERAFDRPDVLDIDRHNPKAHLSFGTGIHTCAGRLYARHVIVAMFSHLLAHAKNFRFSPAQTDFDHDINVIVCGFRELHVEFDAIA